ncbi:MAG: mechanosensitive ion channel family protein [Clostridia bacterium]|nr:mechanosensitive ion channel family protein [Clostridia bacterium]
MLDIIKRYPTLWEAIKLVVVALLTFIGVTFVLWFERKLTKRLMRKWNNINMRFVESIVRFVIVFVAAQWVVMYSPLTSSFGRVLFQGTTVIAAIAGFAAQPVIADMICGLMLSATRPFNIGDRIELEDGTAGIVKDITLRHVTLQLIDTMVKIIPNSKLNGMEITNMSFKSQYRSIHMRFNVAYDADAEKAIKVISDAVEQSAWTVPGKAGAYGPVYFIEYADSALVMATTVYYAPSTPTEVVRSDVNRRVKRALDENGIEIPYNYVNVVMKSGRE